MIAAFPAPWKSKLALGCVASLLVVASAAGTASALPEIKILRGANQQTTYGSDFPAPLEVWVTDSVTERAVSGLRIDFTPDLGILLSSTSAVTDERGLASVTANGLAACTSSVSAEVSGSSEARVSFEGLVVDKAVLTIVPANLSAQLNASVPIVTNYSFTGFMNGDTEGTARISGSPVLTTTASDSSPHANYAIKGGVGTLSAPNYTFVAGFGTLAVLGGTDSGQSQDPLLDPSRDSAQAVPQNLPAHEDEAVVRSALLNQSMADVVPQPEFVAGLRGASGVFVVNAIWPNPASAFHSTEPLYTRSALAEVMLADDQKAPDAPVQAVDLPKMTAFSTSAAQSSDTRSALQTVTVSAPKVSDASVRAVLSTNPTAAYTRVPNSLTGSAIRKAFNPSGIK
jgi:hypothetical protein